MNDVNNIIENIRRGEIDCNCQSLFFKILIRGLMMDLKRNISIRNIPVPHFILNTGDEAMYLEIKGQDHSKEPLNNTNEDYVYTTIPRCILDPKGINLSTDQLTSPYTYGKFQFEHDDVLTTLVAEFRRMPIVMNVDLQYVVPSFTDLMELTQKLISKLSFIRTFNIVYMGQTIICSYKLPDGFDGENLIDFDESITDDRRHKLALSIEIETNYPIFDPKTVISSDTYIKHIIINGEDYVKPVYKTEQANIEFTDETDEIKYIDRSGGKNTSHIVNVVPKGSIKI